MSSEKKLHDKIVEIQSQLKAPKGQFNNYGGYKYRSCEDICEAVKPLLAERGLVLTLKDEIIEIGGWIFLQASAVLTDGADYKQTVAYARIPDTKKGMDASQITGAASSYARKYALNGLFLIDDTKDADTMPPEKETKTQKQTASKADEAYLANAIRVYIEATQDDDTDFESKRDELDAWARRQKDGIRAAADKLYAGVGDANADAV